MQLEDIHGPVTRLPEPNEWEVRKRQVEASSIHTTLNERGKRYGPFRDHAELTQNLKADMKEVPGWMRLNDSQKEALEMIQHKIGRILNGDPNYDDSWRDIAGYAQLVVDQLEGKNT